MATVNPAHPAAVGLFALLPVAVYAVSGSASVVALSAVCVLVIAGSLYVMFGADDRRSAAA
ncbi:MAG: cytochrome-ba3 oxidase subunit [Haloferacaceae archaeon]